MEASEYREQEAAMKDFLLGIRKRFVRCFQLVGIVAVLCWTGLEPAIAQDNGRPNILFIAVDDLKPQTGCYGDSLAITPNIDAIASRGTLFKANYCQQAVCAPSRASLLTGRYPDQTRVWDLQTQMREMNPGIVTIPQYFRQFGYTTAATGKVFDPRSVDDGRDVPSWSVPYRGPWNIKYYDEVAGKPSAYFYASPEAKDTIALLEAEAIELGEDPMSYIRKHYFPPFEKADVPLDAYTDGAISNVGIELLDELSAGNAPFFLAVGFHRPHLPFNAPSEFWDMYQEENFSLAGYHEKALGSPDIAYHNSEELRSYTGIPQTGSIPEATQRKLIHGYYAATSYIDHLIGILIGHLDSLGLSDNTVLVLWGDHGWHLGDHDLWCKHSNFEQATRSLLIISHPGQTNRGSATASPTEFTDIAPTLCELAGLPVPAFFEGESLVPVMTDTMATVREASLSQYPRNGKMGYSLRTERYRYTRWTNNDGTLYANELYDYLEDPMETIDFSEDDSYQTLVSRFDSMLVERIRIPSTQNRIRFEVTGTDPSGDTVAISDASIYFEAETRLTGPGGSSLFTHVNGDFSFLVTAKRYDPCSDTLRIEGDTTVHLFIGNPDMHISIRAENFYTGEAVRAARVVLNSEEQMTGPDGWITLTEKTGTYEMLVETDGFETWSGMINVAGDTSLTCRLKPTRSTVKIIVKEGVNPVAGLPVILDTLVRMTNSWGIALFEDISTQAEHPWIVEKEGYATRSGTIHLLADTTVSVLIEQATFQSEEERTPKLHIWPNPATDMLHLSHPGQGPFILQLMDSSGRVMLNSSWTGNYHRINLGALDRGIYLLGIRSRNGIQVRRVEKL